MPVSIWVAGAVVRASNGWDSSSRSRSVNDTMALRLREWRKSIAALRAMVYNHVEKRRDVSKVATCSNTLRKTSWLMLPASS